jgi:hypothetical protein
MSQGRLRRSFGAVVAYVVAGCGSSALLKADANSDDPNS